MDFKEVIEILFLPKWSTHAYICKDGDIWVQLQLGKCYNRQKFVDDPSFESYNEKFIQLRLDLFDELDEYYKTKYKK